MLLPAPTLSPGIHNRLKFAFVLFPMCLALFFFPKGSKLFLIWPNTLENILVLFSPRTFFFLLQSERVVSQALVLAVTYDSCPETYLSFSPFAEFHLLLLVLPLFLSLFGSCFRREGTEQVNF